MLEVKNLKKVYTAKGGVTVKALDDVSVKFPEKGMVFLLGRSGSGKSTLLNMLGGLDKPDGGEIIVKGRSSKDFSSSDFDSYRNTFIGFVFQEYNILNEFTVEQNIALALRLQSKPNDKKAVNALLEQVDLKGFGKRKPNTLSGGQKQRVAIARALIKEPEIIMADEPTGALDSNTGRQVFDTLKKLSETKLVIVVSHDREFAEFYGDRIIELKDGKILTDVSKTFSVPKNAEDNVQVLSDDTITIKKGEKLTDSEIKNIISLLKKNGGEAVITTNKRDVPEVKRVCKINENGSKESFADTPEIIIKSYDGKNTRFIKSKLPLSHAFKMGASGLKTKPVRLIFTILLSVVAFVMFGVVSTFMLYDKDFSISEALKVADYDSVAITNNYIYQTNYMTYNIESGTVSEDDVYENANITRFSSDDIKKLNDNTEGLKFAGVFNFSDSIFAGKSFNLGISTDSDYYVLTGLDGFTDCGEEYMTANGFTLLEGLGKYPTANNEIAVSEYIYESFKASRKVNSVSEMLTKTITINGDTQNFDLKVVGVYKTGTIPSKFDTLKEKADTSTKSKQEEREGLIATMYDMLSNSFYSIGYVSSDFYDTYKSFYYNYSSSGGYVSEFWTDGFTVNYNKQDNISYYYFNGYTDTIVNYNKTKFKLYDLNGNEVAMPEDFKLAKNEAYIPYSTYNEIVNQNLQHLSNMYNIESDKYSNLGFNYGFETEIYNQYNDLCINYISKRNEISNGEDCSVEFNNLKTFYEENSVDTSGIDFDYVFGSSNALTVQKYLIGKYLYERFPIDDKTIVSAIMTAVHNDYEKITGDTKIENAELKLYYQTEKNQEGEFEIKGYFDTGNGNSSSFLVSDEFVKQYTNLSEYTFSATTTNYVRPTDFKYAGAITLTDNTQDQIAFLLKGDEENSTVTEITNNVYQSLTMFVSLIEDLNTVFLIIGGIVGGFAALMLLNFISVSISAKQKDIGILRAVGARGTDVFKIFFSEAFIIAMICFVISAIASGYVCKIINDSVASVDLGELAGTISTSALLDFNIVNISLILLISLGVSLIATFFPVFFAARKSPVESIRAL